MSCDGISYIIDGTQVVYNFQNRLGKSFKNAKNKSVCKDIFPIGS